MLHRFHPVEKHDRALALACSALRTVRKAEWDENAHPRAPDGKFGQGGGGGSKSSQREYDEETGAPIKGPRVVNGIDQETGAQVRPRIVNGIDQLTGAPAKGPRVINGIDQETGAQVRPRNVNGIDQLTGAPAKGPRVVNGIDQVTGARVKRKP